MFIKKSRMDKKMIFDMAALVLARRPFKHWLKIGHLLIKQGRIEFFWKA